MKRGKISSNKVEPIKHFELMLAERNNIYISYTEDQQWQTDWSLQREWEAGNHGDGSCRERLYHIYIYIYIYLYIYRSIVVSSLLIFSQIYSTAFIFSRSV
jgi:hypothetical protein